jgi:hypothetical protein
VTLLGCPAGYKPGVEREHIIVIMSRLEVIKEGTIRDIS